MKKIFLIFTLLLSVELSAQDNTAIVVNIRDNAKLEYGGAAVKMKAVVLDYSPIYFGSKEFQVRVSIQMYQGVAGAYGGKITTLILADQTLSEEEKIDLLDRFRDRDITYTSANKWVDASGNSVLSTAPGAITELAYWQSFKLNHASLGMTSASTQGALDAEYKIIQAIVAKLNQRKNF